MTLAPGQTVGGYQILEQIGRGGMASVFKAYQTGLSRFVAIKVLPASYAEDQSFRVRFQNEATAIARLRHLPDRQQAQSACTKSPLPRQRYPVCRKLCRKP